MNQYFTLFGLPETFTVDTDELDNRYRVLAARFHPDKFAAASAFEQKQAVMMSSAINEAYRTLKNPIDRASYLLKMRNIDADAPEHTSFAPEFLMQQMEWREALTDAQMEGDQAAIAALDQEIQNEQKALLADLNRAFGQDDNESAAQLVRQGRFLDKLHNEIATALS